MADLESKHLIVREDHRGRYLVPGDLMSEEWLATLKVGDAVGVQARKSRSYQNHKHFFVLLHKARLHLEAYQDDDTLLDALKIAVGHTRPVQLANGEIVFIPASINWDSMGEDDFRRFKNRCLFVLTQLLGFDPLELMNNHIEGSNY